MTQVNTNQAMVKSVGAMMREILSRKVALLYNLKKVNDKKTKLFIETQSYTILKGMYFFIRENNLADNRLNFIIFLLQGS